MKSLAFWTIALMALFYFTDTSYAEDWSLKFGPGIQNGSTTDSTKIAGLRREEELMDGLHYATEVGGWVDNGGDGRKDAEFAKLQLGIKPGPEVGTFAKLFSGPCFITQTDSQLGGIFQFCTDIGVGIRDKKAFVDVNYSHISSAGLESPNHGRDYLVFEGGLRFD